MDFQQYTNFWNPSGTYKSFEYFDKSFTDDPVDNTYCHLNEIEANLSDTIPEDNDILQDTPVYDPRTKKKIKSLEINHTGNESKFSRMKFLRFPSKSLLTSEQHSACLDILKFTKEGKVLPTISEEYYKELLPVINKEKNEFRAFVETYLMSNSYLIFEEFNLCRRIYRFYIKYIEGIARDDPEMHFSLQTALPFTLGKTGSVCHPSQEIIQYCNRLPVFNPCTLNLELSRLKKQLNKITIENFNQLMNSCTRNVFNKLPPLNSLDVILPEESLIFLLCQYEEENPFSEMIVKICEKDNENEGGRLIYCDKPFPSRNINCQNTSIVLEKFLKDRLEKSVDTIWYEMNRKTIVEKDNKTCKEIHAVDLEQNYKLISLEDYMENCKESEQKVNLEPIFVKWQLQPSDSVKVLNVFTEKTSSFCEFSVDQANPVNISLKLEQKCRFGGEIMTKSEIIKEIVGNFLLPNSEVKRVRLDKESFDVLMVERFNFQKLQNELLRLYNSNFFDMLIPVYKFLNGLLNFPEGQYMLKFNSKHPEKIMIYRSVQQKTENSLSTHCLYNKETLRYYNFFGKDNVNLPIDDMVIFPIHEKHKILPCCFPPWGKNRRKYEIVNDKSKILKKFQDKEEKKSKIIKLKEENKARLKKKRKRERQRKRKAENKKNSQQNEESDEYDPSTSFFNNSSYGGNPTMSTSKETSNEIASSSIESKSDDAFNEIDFSKYLADAGIESECDLNY